MANARVIIDELCPDCGGTGKRYAGRRINMTRDEMIEVAARALWSEYPHDWGRITEREHFECRIAARPVIDALIAAGVIADPETTVMVEREYLEMLERNADGGGNMTDPKLITKEGGA